MEKKKKKKNDFFRKIIPGNTMWNKILTYLIILYPLYLFSVYTKHLAQLDIMLFIIIYLFINDNTVYLFIYHLSVYKW